MRRIAIGVCVGALLLAVVPLAFSGHTTEGGGLPVLIKTKATVIIPEGNDPPTRGKGTVLRGSFLGERRFCRGGEFTDRLKGAPPNVTVNRRFECKGGSLRIRFKPRAPRMQDLNQSGRWRVTGGTGRYADLEPGHGSMFARFNRCCPTARETFTGTVANK